MRAENLNADADTLIDLLTAQCADLETLLTLAKRETAATEGGDFGEVLSVVDERARLGERLEVYHLQVAEMRARLGADADAILSCETAHRTTRLVAEIQAQDRRTLPLLTARREEVNAALARLRQTERHARAYQPDARREPVACDRRA